MAIRREGAIEATMAGLKFYHLDAAVQRPGLAFLASIASSGKKVAMALGLEDVLRRALAYFPGDHSIETSARILDQAEV